MSKILAYLLQQKMEMVTTLENWVNHDSPTFNKTALDTLGKHLTDAFAQTGAQVQQHPQPQQGDHYTLTWHYPATNPQQILLLGHFDTVWPAGEASCRPFTVNLDGTATGPGVSDMKAGLVVMLFAMKAICKLNRQPQHPVVLILNSDEEIGSPTSRAIIQAEGRKSCACLVAEPARGQAAITSRKGVGRFTLTASGLAVHSGNDHQQGISAIEELARQITFLHNLTDYNAGTTVNVGIISGGSRANVVAAQATAQIDLRVTSVAEAERMTQLLLGLSPRLAGASISVSGGITRPPFEETPAGLALFQQAQTIAARLGFTLEKASVGGGSDGNFIAGLGIPTLDGLGNAGAGSHALTEHTLIAELPYRAALLAELILSL